MPATLQGTFHTYQVIRRLGQGAFGEVSLALVVETGELVALKRIHVRSTAGVPDCVVREVKALQCCQHPNVVALRDVFPKGQALYLAQEYCLTDLSVLLRRASCPPPEGVAKGVMRQLLRGLEALHTEGLMHRDVKPSNTLLGACGGSVKLADFGLARPLSAPPPAEATPDAAAAHAASAGSGSGSPPPSDQLRHQADPASSTRGGGPYTHAVATRWYRAPELLYGARSYGPAVDMWAAGCVFAELLGLSPLLPGDNDIDQLTRTIATLGSIEPRWPGVRGLPDWGKIAFPPDCPGVPLASLLPGASPAAVAFLDKFLRYDPAQRITAAEALRDPYLSPACPPLPADELAVAAWVHATLAAGAPAGSSATAQQQQQQQPAAAPPCLHGYPAAAAEAPLPPDWRHQELL